MRSILIAEDDATLRKAVATMLRKADYNVIECDNGPEAETIIRNRILDLIILDVMMPGKNGFDICFDLRGEPELRRIPLILITSFTTTSGQDDSYWKELSQAHEFITKPFSMKTLLDKVHEHLARGE